MCTERREAWLENYLLKMVIIVHLAAQMPGHLVVLWFVASSETGVHTHSSVLSMKTATSKTVIFRLRLDRGWSRFAPTWWKGRVHKQHLTIHHCYWCPSTCISTEKLQLSIVCMHDLTPLWGEGVSPKTSTLRSDLKKFRGNKHCVNKPLNHSKTATVSFKIL